MKKKRTEYTQEFKEEAVKLITEQGYQITEAARNLSVNATMSGRWKREIIGGGEDAPGFQGSKAVQTESISLRKENKRSKMEREILTLQRHLQIKYNEFNNL